MCVLLQWSGAGQPGHVILQVGKASGFASTLVYIFVVVAGHHVAMLRVCVHDLRTCLWASCMAAPLPAQVESFGVSIYGMAGMMYIAVMYGRQTLYAGNLPPCCVVVLGWPVRMTDTYAIWVCTFKHCGNRSGAHTCMASCWNSVNLVTVVVQLPYYTEGNINRTSTRRHGQAQCAT